MSSNLRIVKICAYCKQEFIARKTTSQTCSDRCAKRLYNLRLGEKAISRAELETEVRRKPGAFVTEEQVRIIQAKEWLTLVEAALLLNISPLTLRRWVLAGKVSLEKMGRKHIFKKADLKKSSSLNETLLMMDISKNVSIRPLQEADLEAADRVMRLAFGTFLGLPDPLQFMGDRDYVYTRWRADPSAAFCAEAKGVVVGSVFVGNWGSVGFFGPLTVHPDYWDSGVAKLLLQQVMACFERWGTRHMGLYTFPTSLKHIGLYRKLGFSPRFLTVVMEKEVRIGDASAEVSWTKFSDVPVAEREGMSGRCRGLTGTVFEGLDVGVEIQSVAGQQLGETVLLWESDEFAGLAVCHFGAGTEAGSGECYIKFAAVNARGAGDVAFRRLLVACEQLAAQRGLQKLSGGMNTARLEAWAAMLESGWRGKMVGVAMERPSEPGYNRPGVFLIDDWR